MRNVDTAVHLLKAFAISTAITFANFSFAGPYEDGMTALKNKDFVAATKNLEIASNRGDPRAKFELSMLFRSGKAGKVNDQKSFDLLNQAAKLGHHEAQYWLGNGYTVGIQSEFQKGLSTKQRKENAFKFYMLAAEGGYPSAQTMVGRYYNNGDTDLNITKNYRNAVKWYKLAADQGYADGQGLLASMYHVGHGVPQNYAEAFRLFRLAAEQGDPFGQRSLGHMYLAGDGVKRNLVLAHMYFNLAAVNEVFLNFQQEIDIKMRNQIESRMTTQDVNLAQKLAKECLSRNYKNCAIQ